MITKKKQILVAGSSISPAIVSHLAESGLGELIPASVGKFGSGEPFCELFPKGEADYAVHADKLKGAHAVILQSTGEPVSEHCLQTLVIADTLKAAGVAKMTAVLPFKAFDRQDRVFDKRFTSMSAKLFAKLLKASGVDAVVAVTPHSQASVDYFKEVFGDNFRAVPATALFARHIRETLGADALTLSIGAPDGAEKEKDQGQLRARELARDVFNTAAADRKAMFHISKIHTDVSETKVTHFDGDVKGKNCVIVDDMIDGGSTMVNAASVLKAQGAATVTAYATHGILTGNALEKILSAKPDGAHDAIDRLVVTDTLPDVAEKLQALAKTHPALAARVTVLSAGELIAAELRKMNAPKPRPPSPPSA